MQPIPDRANENRLRFIFDDAVVSLDLAAHATFEDIAQTLGELAQEHHINPLAIDVTFAIPIKIGRDEKQVQRRASEWASGNSG